MASKVDSKAAIEQVKHVDAVIDQHAKLPARAVFDDIHARVVQMVSRGTRGMGRNAEIGATEKYVVSSAVSVSSRLMTGVGDQLRASTRATMTESLAALSSYAAHARLPKLTQAQQDSIVQARVRRLLDQRTKTAASLTANIISSVISKVKLSRARTMDDLITEVDQAFQHEWWRVERVINTETAHAYNIARMDAIRSMNDQSASPTWQRWTEMVDDTTGMPLDERVGDDSMILHAQVALPNDNFIMPPLPSSPWNMRGDEYACPPNRPNDRAVLIPWQAGSGVPAWVWRNGKRVVLTGGPKPKTGDWP